MLTREAYAFTLAILTTPPVTGPNDMGAIVTATILESDTIPEADTSADELLPVLAFSMFPADSRPMENPRASPWRSSGWVQVHIMVPSKLGPLQRIDMTNAVSDRFKAATPNVMAINYKGQTCTMPDQDDAGVYAVVTMQIAWDYDEPMPPSGAT